MKPEDADAAVAILILLLCVLLPTFVGSVIYDLRRKRKIKKRAESKEQKWTTSSKT